MNRLRKYIKFYFELIDGSELRLTYELIPNSLRDRWIEHAKKRQAEVDSYLNLKIANKTSKDIFYLMNKLNAIVEEINYFYDKKLPSFNSINEIDRNILNYLHEEFEEYGDRHQKIINDGRYYENLPLEADAGVWPGIRFNKNFHEAWLSLNEWIHITESAMDIGDNTFPGFSCLVHVYPPVPGESIKEEDKLFLETNFKWGDLYLGYNTLGKDYAHTALDGDDRVISNDQIKTQSLFSTEMWLNFSAEAEINKNFEMKFYHWYTNLDLNVKKMIPIDDLNKLALGRYFMGRVIIDDSFLNICNDVTAWSYDWNIRKRWNTEVFSQIEHVIKMEIIE